MNHSSEEKPLRIINTNDIDVPIQRKLFWKEISPNPFIPIGILATTGVLCCGLYAFMVGNTQTSQYMMRARVGFQGLAVVGISTAIAEGILKFHQKK
jgi:hypothetical protein